jgi:hypothetical protein
MNIDVDDEGGSVEALETSCSHSCRHVARPYELQAQYTCDPFQFHNPIAVDLCLADYVRW